MMTRSMTRKVKEAAAATGLDARNISAHSLRAGFATAAAQAGRSERDIMRHGRWQWVETARLYIRDGQKRAVRGLL
jgi:integrase